jgi:hypothetical protein
LKQRQKTFNTIHMIRLIQVIWHKWDMTEIYGMFSVILWEHIIWEHETRDIIFYSKYKKHREDWKKYYYWTFNVGYLHVLLNWKLTCCKVYSWVFVMGGWNCFSSDTASIGIPIRKTHHQILSLEGVLVVSLSYYT